MVAVTTPVVLASTMLALLTDTELSLRVTSKLVDLLIPVEAIAVFTSATSPVRVVIPVASTTAVVLASIALRSVAAADPETETPTPVGVLMPADVIADLTFAAEPQMRVNPVAFTTAVVLASIVFRAVAGAVPELRVTPTPEAVLIPPELMAVATSPAAPVSVVAAVALMVPLV